ncbi:hypothetical protein Ancab_023596 [Ancistrocladus abbreviatus]
MEVVEEVVEAEALANAQGYGSGSCASYGSESRGSSGGGGDNSYSGSRYKSGYDRDGGGDGHCSITTLPVGLEMSDKFTCAQEEEKTKSWKTLVTVAVSGAAGMIANHLLFKLTSGEVFGPDQPIALKLLGIIPSFRSALICLKNAPNIPAKNFHALTRLDENRAKCQAKGVQLVDLFRLYVLAGIRILKLALKAGVFYDKVLDFLNAKISGLPVKLVGRGVHRESSEGEMVKFMLSGQEKRIQSGEFDMYHW